MIGSKAERGAAYFFQNYFMKIEIKKFYLFIDGCRYSDSELF